MDTTNHVYPQGASEPGSDVRALQCVATGALLVRSPRGWVDEAGQCFSWKQINHWDPLYPGYCAVSLADHGVAE